MTDKSIFKDAFPQDKQVGGSHYKSFHIQPYEFISKNDLSFFQGNVIKYVCRYLNKNGIEDLNKIIHYCELEKKKLKDMEKKKVIVPHTEWIIPKEYPDLRSADEIAIDLETRDPDLKSKGSGAISGNGEIVGFAVAVDGYKNYFPIAHEQGPNMDRKKTIEWFKDICESPATKIFHNAMYDVCWIRNLGIKINGLIIDTMIASSLIDENRFSYTLNTLSWHHLGEGKNEARLNQAAKERGLDPKADMWRMPAMEVGGYAEKDAELTLKLWHKLKIIIEDNLQDIFNLETDLFPCLVDMRHLGVRVDIEKANQLETALAVKEENLLQQVKIETGVDTQIWAAASIAKVFDKLKLPYTRTEKTNSPSFTKNFISNHANPVVNMIAEARKINKVRTTFIDTILKHEHKGRIHADINQIDLMMVVQLQEDLVIQIQTYSRYLPGIRKQGLYSEVYLYQKKV